jgi:hypothetical protein
MKPDPAIYRIVEEDCGIAPGALLFADDKRANVDAAAARGWQGHLFDGPEGWPAGSLPRCSERGGGGGMTVEMIPSRRARRGSTGWG